MAFRAESYYRFALKSMPAVYIAVGHSHNLERYWHPRLRFVRIRPAATPVMWRVIQERVWTAPTWYTPQSIRSQRRGIVAAVSGIHHRDQHDGISIRTNDALDIIFNITIKKSRRLAQQRR